MKQDMKHDLKPEKNTSSFTSMTGKMHNLVKTYQKKIAEKLESYDENAMITDIWDRSGGGGGITKVLEQGTVFDKAGVNTSEVFGEIKAKEAPMFKQLLTHQGVNADNVEGCHFYATGISLVFHPKNPFAPTTHMNYRYFELVGLDEPVWWFGGGSDLTPYYLDENDARHFHLTHKIACDQFDTTFYPKFKARCDEYFYLPHRQETRGVGGIFFDYLNDRNPDEIFKFIELGLTAFIDAYFPIFEKQYKNPFLENHVKWQRQRRGRYVEFNLLYDRGTLFGLKTGGRIESILMSLPSDVSWNYNVDIDQNSDEYNVIKVLKEPRSWVD